MTYHQADRCAQLGSWFHRLFPCHTALLSVAVEHEGRVHHNLRLTDVRETEHEAEYDSADIFVNAIAAALEAAGHEVEKVEVPRTATNLLERLEAIDPDIIFNTAEGNGGRMREAFYPALFEELGILLGLGRVHERDHARQVADQADGPEGRHRHAARRARDDAQLT